MRVACQIGDDVVYTASRATRPDVNKESGRGKGIMPEARWHVGME
jgi:hypothetical protein